LKNLSQKIRPRKKRRRTKMIATTVAKTSTLTREFLTSTAERAGKVCLRIRPEDADAVLTCSEKQEMSFMGRPVVIDSSVPESSVYVVKTGGGGLKAVFMTAVDELGEATGD
jgi:hypothetical protein